MNDNVQALIDGESVPDTSNSNRIPRWGIVVAAIAIVIVIAICGAFVFLPRMNGLVQPNPTSTSITAAMAPTATPGVIVPPLVVSTNTPAPVIPVASQTPFAVTDTPAPVVFFTNTPIVQTAVPFTSTPMPVVITATMPITVSYEGKWLLAGFDVNEFGGDDSECKREGDVSLEMTSLGEVVGSSGEHCKIVIEWSLKDGSSTIVTGVYALEPGENFYIPLSSEGRNGLIRIVGTIWYLPRGWNAHLYAFYLGQERDARDNTVSYIGLSPTDPWVLALIRALTGR